MSVRPVRPSVRKDERKSGRLSVRPAVKKERKIAAQCDASKWLLILMAVIAAAVNHLWLLNTDGC